MLGAQRGHRLEVSRARDNEDDNDVIKALVNEVNENRTDVKNMKEDVKEIKIMLQDLMSKRQDTN